MSKAEILERLNLGASVAENDENLESYFVPTIVLDDFLADRYDLIRGAKGSGKSAILRMVSKNPGSYPQLKDVQLTVATEHTGEPAFKRAFNGLDPDVPDELRLLSASDERRADVPLPMHTRLSRPVLGRMWLLRVSCR